MLPQIAIFTAGVATTAYGWYRSSTKEEDQEPTFTDDLVTVAKYALLIVVVFILLRWMYKKGSTQ
jgi:hypothetical protein